MGILHTNRGIQEINPDLGHLLRMIMMGIGGSADKADFTRLLQLRYDL